MHISLNSILSKLFRRDQLYGRTGKSELFTVLRSQRSVRRHIDNDGCFGNDWWDWNTLFLKLWHLSLGLCRYGGLRPSAHAVPTVYSIVLFVCLCAWGFHGITKSTNLFQENLTMIKFTLSITNNIFYRYLHLRQFNQIPKNNKTKKKHN